MYKSILDVQEYIIVFNDSGFDYNSFVPLVNSIEQFKGCTFPHGFDRKLINCIPIIKYCLHLPRSIIDLSTLKVDNAYVIRDYGSNQMISIVPFGLLKHKEFFKLFSKRKPSFVFCDNVIYNPLKILIEQYQLQFPLVKFDDISEDKLKLHWQKITDDVSKVLKRKFSFHRLKDQFILSEDFSSIAITLPTLFVERALFYGKPNLPKIDKSQEINYLFHLHAIKKASIIGLKSVDQSPQELLKIDMDNKIWMQANQTLKIPVCIGIPGIPNWIKKGAIKSLGPTEIDIDKEVENQVLSLIVTHNALSHDGMGFLLSEPSKDIFEDLHNLENHCMGSINPRFVWRMLNKIGVKLNALMDNRIHETIRKASSITIFSNIPFGLAILPGCTSPLSCQLPVWYQPIMPLTRALQREMGSIQKAYLGNGVRVLIAELISEEDFVGKVSRKGWETIIETFKNDQNIQFDCREFKNVNELNMVLKTNNYEILILSAHGFYDQKRNIAGVICDKTSLSGYEINNLPPLVILSSCNTVPRGHFAVSIVDNLLRQGAIAVIGSLVPIDVSRNTIFVLRFFIYLMECLEANYPFRTIAELWHFFTTSNAYHDITSANPQIEKWANFEGKPEETVNYEFKMKSSVGKLRGEHFYQDTENVLHELAVKRGIENKFRGWMSNGYFPESLLYMIVGQPDKIFIQDDKVKKIFKIGHKQKYLFQ
jgi:hypothetical protein